jgi:hypothetical protein
LIKTVIGEVPEPGKRLKNLFVTNGILALHVLTEVDIPRLMVAENADILFAHVSQIKKINNLVC